MHRVYKCNKKSWLKPFIDINTELRKKSQNNFEKDFFKLMNNAVFGKTIENKRKHKDIKLVTTKARRNCLLSEPRYHATKHFFKIFISHRTEKAQIFMNKPVYIGLSILEISNIAMYKFRYDCVKPKYEEKAKLCNMDTDSFIFYIKIEDI